MSRGTASLIFAFFLSCRLILTVSLAFFLSHLIFQLYTELDNPYIFNMAASSKLWTYSLAFRVLMKARRVLALSLFPSISNSTPLTQLRATTPSTTCTHVWIAITSPFFVGFGTEFNYRLTLKNNKNIKAEISVGWSSCTLQGLYF